MQPRVVVRFVEDEMCVFVFDCKVYLVGGEIETEVY